MSYVKLQDLESSSDKEKASTMPSVVFGFRSGLHIGPLAKINSKIESVERMVESGFLV